MKAYQSAFNQKGRYTNTDQDVGDERDRFRVRSYSEYARARTGCPNCGAHVSAIGRDTETTERPNCGARVRA
ncbi:hypothetical protein EXE46_08075 [Halorubrum sp. GN11_10-6_MGM]|nr:hypothetical protein EXE46_08075 [Halorubrum sp. GN11_10-6_MGM]